MARVLPFHAVALAPGTRADDARRTQREEAQQAQKRAEGERAAALAGACRTLRAFLAQVHVCEENCAPARGALYAPGEALRLAIERYAAVWMPVLAENARGPASPLAAPIDVQWVHHLHRLDPEAYARDCRVAFGFVVDAAGNEPFLCAGKTCKDAEAEARARDSLVALLMKIRDDRIATRTTASAHRFSRAVYCRSLVSSTRSWTMMARSLRPSPVRSAIKASRGSGPPPRPPARPQPPYGPKR